MKVLRSLFETIGKISDLDDQYELIKQSQPFCCSNYSRLTEIMKTKLKSLAEISALNDISFQIAQSVSDHKVAYEKAMGNAFNQLLLATAKHVAKPMQNPKPSQKVIKHSVKVKADKPCDPKIISVGHTKELMKNALATHNMAAMIAQGIPQAIAVQAIGTLYDPVEGAGASDPSIWGPVL